jgi:hypothetical protein
VGDGQRSLRLKAGLRAMNAAPLLFDTGSVGKRGLLLRSIYEIVCSRADPGKREREAEASAPARL